MTFAAMPSPGPRPPQQRSRARRFVPLGIAAWVVLEVWLLIAVGDATNGLTVFVLLAAGVVAGSLVIKRAGRRAWRNLTETLQAAGPTEQPASPRPPADGKGNNTLRMLGGLLLMVPGLLSDVAGLLCLFPPTGKLIQRRAEKLLSGRAGTAPGSFGDAFRQARIHHPDGKVVQGEVIRDDEPPSPPRQDPPLTR
ncbi:FxsA family membrane protein [Streptomyces natalensis]|uniref:Membrane protein n=1 Tax=Streptomyces natalensis ATCC 27448 TaxID=1240678 RepID=A0A0D7CL67_9ACTN|nr:FxsA family membrane protein [Streptomyces natalensis]KIZ16959.1 membrane protein [Streptomyces natalensis ATCC 27448]